VGLLHLFDCRASSQLLCPCLISVFCAAFSGISAHETPLGLGVYAGVDVDNAEQGTRRTATVGEFITYLKYVFSNGASQSQDDSPPAQVLAS